MKKFIMTSVALVAVSMMVISAFAIPIEATDDPSFTIEYTLKGKNYSVDFDGPVDKVIVFGYAACLTVLDTGKVDKLYACDKYGDDAFTEKGMTKSCESIANLSGTNVEAIKTKIVQAKEAGDITFDSAIILTTMTTAAESVINELAPLGFNHIVFYGSMSEYADIIQCVKEIELIVGSEANLHQTMKDKCDDVAEKVKDAPKKDAIFIWYSTSSGWGYGNTGSLGVTMINAGGGNNIGYTEGSSTGIIYDQSAIIQKLGASPECVIFLDDAYIRSYGGSVEKFTEELMGGSLGKHWLVVMEHPWNNYDPESADGLIAMASAMHPDLVESDVKIYKDVESKDNTILYVGMGVAGAILAVGLIFVFLRMRK